MAGRPQIAVSEYMRGSQEIADNRLPISVDEEISYLNVDKSMLLHLMNKMGKQSVDQVKHRWWTQERKSDFVALSSDTAGGAWDSGAAVTGTVTLNSTDDVHLFAKGDIVMFPSDSLAQTYYVTAVNSSTGVISLTTMDGSTTKNFSGTTLNDQNIFRLATSFEEGGGRGTIKTESETEVYNVIQIFQNPYGITTTAQHINYRGIDEEDKIAFETGVDHAFEIEKALFYSELVELTEGHEAGQYQQNTMGGLVYWIDEHVDSQPVLTQSEFSSWLDDWTKYSESPFCFVGELIFEGLKDWAETKLDLVRSEDTLGMAITKYVTSYGTQVMLAPHRELLTGDLKGEAFGLDMSDLKYLYLEGLDTTLWKDIQDSHEKQKIDEYRTWCSLKVGNQKKHGRLKDVATISLS